MHKLPFLYLSKAIFLNFFQWVIIIFYFYKNIIRKHLSGKFTFLFIAKNNFFTLNYKKVITFFNKHF